MIPFRETSDGRCGAIIDVVVIILDNLIRKAIAAVHAPRRGRPRKQTVYSLNLLQIDLKCELGSRRLPNNKKGFDGKSLKTMFVQGCFQTQLHERSCHVRRSRSSGLRWPPPTANAHLVRTTSPVSCQSATKHRACLHQRQSCLEQFSRSRPCLYARKRGFSSTSRALRRRPMMAVAETMFPCFETATGPRLVT